MTLRQGNANPESIRVHKATPKAATSNIILCAAWLAGTTGYFLSILATTLAQCIRWLSAFEPESGPPPFAGISDRVSNRPPRPKPIAVHPLLSRENVERHVSFSLGSRTGRNAQKSLPSSSETTTCMTASFSSGDSTLCSSPLSDLSDLPPLKNLPPLLLDPQVPEQIQVKKRPTSANFPIKARNPFKFRRPSTSSAPSPTPPIGEVLPVCPSIDRPSTPPVELSSRKPSLIKRFSANGRRARSLNVTTESPPSAPTSPRLWSSSPCNPTNTSKRSASVNIPPQTLESLVLAPSSPRQGSPRRTLFNSFTRRPRTASLSVAPARTQPYGPPYNCPLPTPQPRRSSGTRRSVANTQTSIPAN